MLVHSFQKLFDPLVQFVFLFQETGESWHLVHPDALSYLMLLNFLLLFLIFFILLFPYCFAFLLLISE